MKLNGVNEVPAHFNDLVTHKTDDMEPIDCVFEIGLSFKF